MYFRERCITLRLLITAYIMCTQIQLSENKENLSFKTQFDEFEYKEKRSYFPFSHHEDFLFKSYVTRMNIFSHIRECADKGNNLNMQIYLHCN